MAKIRSCDVRSFQEFSSPGPDHKFAPDLWLLFLSCRARRAIHVPWPTLDQTWMPGTKPGATTFLRLQPDGPRNGPKERPA